MRVIRLLPCPLCGGEKTNIHTFNIVPDVWVGCEDCNCGVEFCVPWKKKESIKHHDKRCYKEALKLWNRRTGPKEGGEG
jgi:hypothetical protein